MVEESRVGHEEGSEQSLRYQCLPRTPSQLLRHHSQQHVHGISVMDVGTQLKYRLQMLDSSVHSHSNNLRLIDRDHHHTVSHVPTHCAMSSLVAAPLYQSMSSAGMPLRCVARSRSVTVCVVCESGKCTTASSPRMAFSGVSQLNLTSSHAP